MTEGDFCPRCGHLLDSDQTPATADPGTGSLPPTLPEDDRPAPGVFTPVGENDRGAAGDELQAVQVPDPGRADTPAGDAAVEASAPEDRADLPTARLNPVEPPGEAGDAAPDTSDAEGGPEQDETGEFVAGNWTESAEATPEIVEHPAGQEAMPEAPAAPDLAAPQAAAAERAPLPHPWLAELADAAEIHPPQLEERPPDVADTMPRLTGDLIQPTEAFDSADRREDSAAADITSQVLVQAAPAAPTHIPPAPYTPPPMPEAAPPAFITPPPAPYAPALYAPAYAPAPAVSFMQQRVQLYQRDGYRLLSRAPHEVVLARGKHLGAGGWLLALVSVGGALWYLLILLLSGFQRDRVYITLEGDGYVYEDGPGAAHVRRQRSRGGRRWGLVGLILFVLAFLLAAGLGIAAAVTVSQDRYQAALREAYPAITLFEERFTAGEADPADVDLMRDGLVAWSIAGGIAVVGLWGGLALIIVGTIHATAYRVNVPALPGAG